MLYVRPSYLFTMSIPWRDSFEPTDGRTSGLPRSLARHSMELIEREPLVKMGPGRDGGARWQCQDFAGQIAHVGISLYIYVDILGSRIGKLMA